LVDSNYGLYSTFQMIYSYRKNENSTFPQLTGQETIQALEMMKKIKTEISSGIITTYIYIFYILFPFYFINDNDFNFLFIYLF